MAREEPVALLCALALAAAAHAQDQRPLPKGSPGALVAGALKVHLYAGEGLPADSLRALARPQVTLWLDTRSNTLKESTVERVARFDEAWVRLRAPLSKTDALVLARIPKAGVWATPKDLEGLSGRVPGVRRIAVEVDGPLDAATAERLAKARPSVVRWRPSGPVDLLGWGLFLALPGQKVLVPAPEELLATRCPGRSRALPALEVHVATLLAMSADVFPCGSGTRVIVPGEVEPWLLQSLVVRDPSVELVVEVSESPEAATRARILMERLGLGPGR
ncbi:MAG: hypothetical protein AMXMBFR34_30930 [Myxococcaceae bacterium]